MVIACGGGASAPAPTATFVPTATPAPTATPDAGPPEPEAQRILAHVRVLAGDIGARPSGSEQEAAAAEYAREHFEAFGYEVEVQEFPVAGRPYFRFSSIDIDGGDALRALAFGGSALRSATGPLLDAGSGDEEAYPDNVSGTIAVVQRGEVFFADMVANARAAGAVALVIVNNERYLFRTQLDADAPFPVVTVDAATGDALRAMLGSPATVTVPEEVTGRNVLARPPGGACRTLSGGHMDSVPWAPGANDNASGSGLVIELARAAAVAGLNEHCFVLWGGEEAGLYGSRHIAAMLTQEERETLRAVFNYDVVGSNAPPIVSGDPGLGADVAAVATRLGIEADVAALPRGIGSDHLSFIDAGLPAVVIAVQDFESIHTPQDTVENLAPVFLQLLADLALALLQEYGEAVALPAATP